MLIVLRAQFDSMLLEEKKETYIDLQIDASKPYYKTEDPELVTLSMRFQKERSGGAMSPSDHSLKMLRSLLLIRMGIAILFFNSEVRGHHVASLLF